jgi:hypothetical protein
VDADRRQEGPDRAARRVHLAPPVPGIKLRVRGELGWRAQPGAGDAGPVQEGRDLIWSHEPERGFDQGRQLAAPAAAEVWSGWVAIAQKTGFGLVSPLPGI